jgi:putative transcriptional regulator
VNSPRTGALLVATPLLTGPTFDRTVILLLAHEAEGSFGVVLNRATDVPVHRVLPDWAPLATEPASVFVGGPVAPQAAICLARLGGEPPAGWTAIGDAGLGTLDLAGSPRASESQVTHVRIFAGYAGWGAGQLEAELEEQAWLVTAAQPDDPFTPVPAVLWRTVLRRQPGLVAALAHYPLNPSLN